MLLTACADKRLHVESDTSWAGNVDNFGEITGHGNSEVELEASGGRQCWDIHKTTSAGTLRAYVRDKKNLLGTDTDGDMTTTEANGHVTGCTQ
jgi:hypothetical protein